MRPTRTVSALIGNPETVFRIPHPRARTNKNNPVRVVFGARGGCEIRTHETFYRPAV